MGAKQRRHLLFKSTLPPINLPLFRIGDLSYGSTHRRCRLFEGVLFLLIRHRPESTCRMGGHTSAMSPTQKCTLTLLIRHRPESTRRMGGQTAEMSSIQKCTFPINSPSSWVEDLSYGCRTSEMLSIQKCTFPIKSHLFELAVRRMGAHKGICCPINSAFSY